MERDEVAAGAGAQARMFTIDGVVLKKVENLNI